MSLISVVQCPLLNPCVITIMALSAEQIAELASEFAEKEPKDIINYALQEFDNIAISFSGAEDVLLIELATKVAKKLGKGLCIHSGYRAPAS